MPKHDNASRVNEPKAPSSTPPHASSYVYPVRSLLSGVRPAREHAHSQGARTPIYCRRSPNTCSDSADVSTPAAPLGKPGNVLIGSSSGETPPFSPSLSGSVIHPPSAQSPGSETACTHESHYTRRKLNTPNFRDFAQDEDPFSRRSFVSTHFVPRTSSMDPGSESIPGTDDLGVAVHHPPQISDFAAEAFFEAGSDDLLPLPDDSLTQYDATIHGRFSHSGIVHLPPIHSPTTTASNPSAPSTISAPSSRGQTSINSIAGSDLSAVRTSVGDAEVVKMPSAQEPGVPLTEIRASGMSMSTGSGESGEGPHIAVRYTHVEDENGHHLIVGREGKLTKCEDEVRVRSVVTRDPTLKLISRFAPLAPYKALAYLSRSKRMSRRAIWSYGKCRRYVVRCPSLPSTQGTLELDRTPRTLTAVPLLPRLLHSDPP